MSNIMLTGTGNWSVLKTDSVDYKNGFGFITDVIIDQHFIERQRFNRLLAACIELQNPGIGIDRETAIWVEPNREIQVFGRGVVLVIGIKWAQFPPSYYEGLFCTCDMTLDIYHAGEKFTY